MNRTKIGSYMEKYAVFVIYVYLTDYLNHITMYFSQQRVIIVAIKLQDFVRNYHTNINVVSVNKEHLPSYTRVIVLTFFSTYFTFALSLETLVLNLCKRSIFRGCLFEK